MASVQAKKYTNKQTPIKSKIDSVSGSEDETSNYSDDHYTEQPRTEKGTNKVISELDT